MSQEVLLHKICEISSLKIPQTRLGEYYIFLASLSTRIVSFIFWRSSPIKKVKEEEHNFPPPFVRGLHITRDRRPSLFPLGDLITADKNGDQTEVG